MLQSDEIFNSPKLSFIALDFAAKYAIIGFGLAGPKMSMM
jgi:hypothetical protein